jgi:hypothetical protein
MMSFLQIKELDATTNPDGKDYIGGTHSQTGLAYEGEFRFPVKVTIDSTGNIKYTADEYLTGIDFQSGTGGTFKSNASLAYLLELLFYAQALEANTTTNPQKVNNITGQLNTDTNLFSGTVSLPIEISIDDDGKVVYTAKPYLS